MSNWTDALTLGTSNASAGDDELRSLMTQFASGVSASFFWPGSGGGSAASGGESKLGNARAAHSTNTTGGYNNGYLGLNPAHASLHHLGGSGMLLGHSSMEDYGLSAILSNGTQAWLTATGSFSLNYSVDGVFGTKNVSLGVSYNTGATVYLFYTVQQSAPNWLVGTSIYGTALASPLTQFTSAFSSMLASPVTAVVFWESIGSFAV